MRVAILYSGGKDSTMSLHYALQQGWEVAALIAVKPRSMEAYLWHYATVEWTCLSAEALGIPLIFIHCEGVGPEAETRELEGVLATLQVDALLLGGIGLQRTQIEAVRRVAGRYGIQVLIPHGNLDHYRLIRQAIELGFDIRVTAVAAEGLGPEWLGSRLDHSSLEKLKSLSERYGFHVGFEGGHGDTFVVDGPIFRKRIEFRDVEKVWDRKTGSGYLLVKEATLVPK